MAAGLSLGCEPPSAAQLQPISSLGRFAGVQLHSLAVVDGRVGTRHGHVSWVVDSLMRHTAYAEQLKVLMSHVQNV